MAIERVKEYLKAFGRDKDILELPESSATVELAAQALHTDPARIAKTLSFYDEGGCILLVTAGDQKVDSGKFKRLFGKKPKMLAFDEVESLTGHKPGGVCPFANPEGVKVYLDQSLQRFDVVYPACGSENSAIALSCTELEQFSGSLGWVDVCKTKEEVPV